VGGSIDLPVSMRSSSILWDSEHLSWPGPAFDEHFSVCWRLFLEFVGIWAESPLSLAWIGLAWLSKPALRPSM